MTGAEGSYIPLIISALGTAASVTADQEAASKRRDIANAQMVKTKAADDKSAAMVVEEGKNYAPEDRQTAMDAQQQATYAQSQRDLGGDAASIIDGAGDSGAVSNDYLRSKADTAISEGKRLTAIARELAKTRAPGQVMDTEQLRRAELSGQLGSMWGSTKRQAQAAEGEAANVETPWWGTAGKIAAAGASAYGAGSPVGSTARVDTTLSGAQLGENVAVNDGWWQTAGNNTGKVKFGQGGSRMFGRG